MPPPPPIPQSSSPGLTRGPSRPVKLTRRSTIEPCPNPRHRRHNPLPPQQSAASSSPRSRHPLHCPHLGTTSEIMTSGWCREVGWCGSRAASGDVAGCPAGERACTRGPGRRSSVAGASGHWAAMGSHQRPVDGPALVVKLTGRRRCLPKTPAAWRDEGPLLRRLPARSFVPPCRLLFESVGQAR